MWRIQPTTQKRNPVQTIVADNAVAITSLAQMGVRLAVPAVDDSAGFGMNFDPALASDFIMPTVSAACEGGGTGELILGCANATAIAPQVFPNRKQVFCHRRALS